MAAEFSVFGGILKPKLGYQSYQNVTHVAATYGTDPANPQESMTAPFTFSKIQVGTDLNFKLFWPVQITVGYTSNDTRNGENIGARPGDNPATTPAYTAEGEPVPYAMSSSLIDLGLVLKPTENLALALGHRHADANGRTNVHWISFEKGIVYDMFGYGLMWNITDTARLDLLYENEYYIAPDITDEEYEQDTIHARVTVTF